MEVLGTLTVRAVGITADRHEGGPTVGRFHSGVGSVRGSCGRKEGVHIVLQGVNTDRVTGCNCGVRIVGHVTHNLRRTAAVSSVRRCQESVFVMSGVAGMMEV